MFVLPHNQRMTYRKIDKTLRSWIHRFVPKWEPDKFGVIFADRADQTSDREYFVRTELDRDVWSVLPAFNYRQQYIPVADGEAVLGFANRYRLVSSDLTIYVHTPSRDFDTQDELAVARDAFQSGDVLTAQRIARRAFPHGHAMFEVLCRLEQRALGKLSLT